MLQNQTKGTNLSVGLKIVQAHHVQVHKIRVQMRPTGLSYLKNLRFHVEKSKKQFFEKNDANDK